MAIKVLVVDDKPMIRRAIVTMMSWESWGCEVIADAEDGLAGKLAIDQYKPDIIVTDIRMPGMDGLSLAEYAGKVLPNCKVIVITGYDDFNYAKESIKLGIIEFLLKPLNDEEFSIAILRAVKQIKQKQHEMKEKEELLPSAKKQFITDRLYGISHSQDTSLLSKQLSSYRFVLLVLNNQDASKWETLANTLAIGIDTELYTIPMPNHHIVFVFLFNHSISSYSVKEKIEKYKKQVHQWHSVVHERLSPFEWSSIVSVSEIDKQYQQISSKLKLQFFNVAEEDTNQKLKLSILHELEQFTSILHTAPDDELTEWIQKLLNRISNYAAKNIRVAKALISEICLTIAKYCYKQFKNEWILDKPLNELLEEVDNLIDMEEARKYIETMLETLRQKKREETPSYSSMVKSILNYIYNHYNQDISLHTLSDRFQLSPGHISRLLRKETNSNFVEILTRTRLNAAKRLMRDPTKRIQEISEMTGFNNYVYFYQVFKRYEKLSPQEYKNRM